MPVYRTRYVNTASTGGNGTTQALSGTNAAYATLNAALVAEVTNLIVTAGDLVINCAGSIADTTDTFVWTGAGWASDATHRLIIQGDAAAPTNDGANLGPSYSTSYYRLEGTGSSGVFRNLGLDLVLSALQFGFNSASAGIGCLALASGAAVTTVDRCRIKMITGSPGSTCVALDVQAGGAAVVNVTNTTIDWANSNNCPAIQCNGALTVTNSTVTNAVFGFYIPSGTATVKNCAVFNCNDDFLISGTLVGSFIAHDDASETGETNHIDISPGTEATDWAAAFAGYTTGDFRVKDTSSRLYNAGTNTGAPATDIIGTTRPQATTVDIGAWEFTTGAPATIPINFNSSVVDSGLADIVTNGTRVHVCSSLPTTYATAVSTSLGNSAITFGAPAASAAGDGRKITSTAITSTGSITATGTVSHWAVVDVAGTRLLAAGPIDVPEAVTAAQVFSLGSLALVLPRQ